MNLKTWAIALQAIQLVYHQCTTLIDLYPFNNIRMYTKRQQRIECIVNVVGMGLPIIFTYFNYVWCALFFMAITILGAYITWWHGYFFRPFKIWKDTYEKKFKTTIIILPPIKDHPIPNLEHFILHLIMLLAFLTTLAYASGFYS